MLAGCSVQPAVKFAQPTEGARARVRVVIPSEKHYRYRGVNAFPNRDCFSNINFSSPGKGLVINSQAEHLAAYRGQKLGMPETSLSAKDNTSQAEIFVAAGQPIIFDYRVTMGEKTTRLAYTTVTTIDSCTLPVSFVPEAGVDYELEFYDILPLKTCISSLSRLNAPTSEKERTPIPVKRVDRCEQ
jgi:hypothetical protein